MRWATAGLSRRATSDPPLLVEPGPPRRRDLGAYRARRRPRRRQHGLLRTPPEGRGMTQQGPRARAIATGALLGDPPPGRTPWAAPHDPNEVPRTGLSAVTATQDYRPDFLSVDQIRPGEPDKGPEGPLPDAPALAPKSTGNGAFEPEKPVATGLEGGAELGSDFSPAVHDKGVVQTDTLRPIT